MANHTPTPTRFSVSQAYYMQNNQWKIMWEQLLVEIFILLKHCTSIADDIIIHGGNLILIATDTH